MEEVCCVDRALLRSGEEFLSLYVVVVAAAEHLFEAAVLRQEVKTHGRRKVCLEDDDDADFQERVKCSVVASKEIDGDLLDCKSKIVIV